MIYDNDTKSDLLLRSLQRALNKDIRSRRITDPDHGPLFSDRIEAGDTHSGTIYVLRSLSRDSFIEKNRNVIHKIGLTTQGVKKRISNARKEPSFLLADVEIVATYELSNIDPRKLESLLHQFFASARLDVELKDRFGHRSDLGRPTGGRSRNHDPEEYLGSIGGLRVAHGGSVAGQRHSDVLPGLEVCGALDLVGLARGSRFI